MASIQHNVNEVVKFSKGLLGYSTFKVLYFRITIFCKWLVCWITRQTPYTWGCMPQIIIDLLVHDSSVFKNTTSSWFILLGGSYLITVRVTFIQCMRSTVVHVQYTSFITWVAINRGSTKLFSCSVLLHPPTRWWTMHGTISIILNTLYWVTSLTVLKYYKGRRYMTFMFSSTSLLNAILLYIAHAFPDKSQHMPVICIEYSMSTVIVVTFPAAKFVRYPSIQSLWSFWVQCFVSSENRNTM